MRKNWYVLLLAALWLLCALIPTAIAEDAINVVGNFELSLNEEPSVATDGLEVPSVDDVPELDPEFSIVLEGADDGQQPGADDPLALSLDDGISLPDGIPENREAAQANDGEGGEEFVIVDGVLIEYNGTGGAVTIDLAEAQLDTGLVRLYKWGAAPSWVLRRTGCEKIGTASPPPGLDLQSARETVQKLSLCRGEALIMLSDGVDGEDVLHRLSLTPDAPPGELAADILEKCGRDTEDDITAAVLRLRPVGLSTS